MTRNNVWIMPVHNINTFSLVHHKDSHKTPIMLQLTNIAKNFNQEKALRDINLNVESGNLTILIGPSGCGKSTLLKIIMGLLLPDSGHVAINGQELKQLSFLEMRRQMGYVIQEGGLFPHLTARQNVALVAEYLKWNSPKLSNRIDELCDVVQLSEALLLKFPHQLSGGQRQRVSLMRALMLDPNILLLDEPLGALDPMIRADLQKDLKRIFQQLSKTVLMVTHDMGEAIYFGDHIVLMRAGKIVQQGKPTEFINNPVDEFVTRFINAQRNPLDSLEDS
jgi:osmoprotectant transport system ATP-binding protein